MKKLENMGSARSRYFMVLAVLLALFVINGCTCATSLVTGGSPVVPGTIDQYGFPAPAGAICASGEKCVDSGKGCGFFAYQNECTNLWNSETNECLCKCQ